MAENWFAQFGYGVIIAAGIAFIPAMIVDVSTCRKNSLDMELSRKKDAQEEVKSKGEDEDEDDHDEAPSLPFPLPPFCRKVAPYRPVIQMILSSAWRFASRRYI
ncbi:unnamed protein product [Clonostachys rhizophaga]|uniref:Uncharacterized protein n=1 Tax=Clonostachys rhizophaga TaxID=160324 RepID=A0A9N9YMB6_9HYPO|nr:unnamed protein product [Clonostachys rhizophaga]